YKSGSTVITPAGKDGVKFVVDLVGTDGTKYHWEISAQYDGKPNKVVGSSPYGDTAAFTHVDARTTKITSMFQGKPTVEQSIVVSADGKTRTTTTKGKDTKGQAVDSTSFYEKQ